MRAKVEVFLKPGVLDVQGKAIQGALHSLGFAAVGEVRVGKTITFDLNTQDRGQAESQARAMCDQLLANTVIESYRVEIT